MHLVNQLQETDKTIKQFNSASAAKAESGLF